MQFKDKTVFSIRRRKHDLPDAQDPRAPTETQKRAPESLREAGNSVWNDAHLQSIKVAILQARQIGPPAPKK